MAYAIDDEAVLAVEDAASDSASVRRCESTCVDVEGHDLAFARRSSPKPRHCLLIIAVIGSGIMASRLSPNDIGLQLLENALPPPAR